jgi:unsaturated chondroitin disaccharide hydrolase
MTRFLPLLFIILLFGCSNGDSPLNDKRTIHKIEKQLKESVETVHSIKTAKLVSPRSCEDGAVKMVAASDWTSGFYPGELWMMHEFTGDNFWKEKALEFTLPLEQEKFNGRTHDMGFKMYCSFGKAYQATQNPKYKEILLQAAKTLSMRFNPNVGCIRSWDHNTDKWDFPVIIDNMMNLELLFWAAKESGNRVYKDIAVSHAETTMKNHFRSDNSSYHVIDYNPETGVVENKNTFQGYAHESAWSRGQAWGLYGYTMVYRETGDEKFLKQAEKIANYILNHPNLPDNKIPYWDFNAPGIPNEPLDASAAAITASALYELSTFSENGNEYSKVADQIISGLSSPEFLAKPGTNNGFLLKHSTGSKPGNSEVDTPLIYADYYYAESLLRKTKYQQ